MMEHSESGHSAPLRTYGNAARVIAPFLERARECTFFVYFDMQVGFLNAAARRDVEQHGGNPSRYPGAVLWTLLDSDSDDPSRCAVEFAAHERVPVYFSSRASTNDRSWVETDVVPLEEGVLVTYRDVNRVHVAEVRATPSSDRRKPGFRVTPDELSLAVIALDARGVVTQWNSGAEQMLGWSAAETIGHPLLAARGESSQRLAALIERARTGGSAAEPVRLFGRGGAAIEASVTASIVRDASEAPGTLLMIADESDRQRNETARRATERMEAVRLLAGGVAHEFNNLLTAIKGFTVLVRASVAGDAHAMQHVSEIDNAADRAAVLTSQLLAFGRGQMLRPERLDVNARLRQIERMLRLMLRENGELLLNLDGEVGEVIVDAAQLEEVVLDLMVAARDAIAGREDGRVIITTSNADLEGEFAGWGVKGDVGPYVRIEVSHNGKGMDAHTQAHIFEPFFTTRADGLQGLGLATVFGIVKQSNGYIWVDSDGDSGAAFNIYLPRTVGAAEPAAAKQFSRKHAHAGTERILLVEDEDAVRRIARRSLEIEGYEIIEASDGASALQLAGEHEIDLIVTDVMMPVMLGTTLVERLRGSQPDLPVLFMSGHCDALVRDGVINPSTPFLQKPFTPDQLKAKVRETLASELHLTAHQ